MQKIYRDRRNALMRRIGDGVAILPTARHAIRNRDSHYPFRFDSHFYYLSGFPEPEAILVLISGKEPKSLLFCREKDPLREIWDGFHYGLDAAREKFLFDEAHPIADFDKMLPGFLADRPSVHYPLGADTDFDRRVLAALEEVRKEVRRGVSAPAKLVDIREILDDMRVRKDAHEIGIMRRAAEISARGHRKAMQNVRPGMNECEIEALLFYEFRRQGAQALAYSSIVAGGENACILHYGANDCELKSGDLLLVDAGCELGGYASDITRTFPVGGKFSGAQKDLYEIVLAAQLAAIEAVKPGVEWDFVHQAAVEVIARGLIDLGLCQGSKEAVIESGDYKKYYMHRTGHWLGLDVHDAGSYKKEGEWVKLVPGMVFTVEPGCYVGSDESIPAPFRGIGIRIEDEVVVTEDGCEILTGAAPKTVGEIEEWMRG